MPPFHPKATVPVPAPTLPSGTGPVFADSIAATTSSAFTRRAANVVQRPAVVGLADDGVDRADRFVAGPRQVQPTTASMAVPTASVLVRTIGRLEIAELFHLEESGGLAETVADMDRRGTFCWKRLPACGTTAVTPVRIESPSTIVRCPTRTPPTSVIAFSGPVPGHWGLPEVSDAGPLLGAAERPSAAPAAKTAARVRCAMQAGHYIRPRGESAGIVAPEVHA